MDNRLSLLYVEDYDTGQSDIYSINNCDKYDTLDFEFLNTADIITFNKKELYNIIDIDRDNVYDINLLNYFIENKKMNFSSDADTSLNWYKLKYRHLKNVNDIIPSVKHKQYLRGLSTELKRVWNAKDTIQFDSYADYNNKVLSAFNSLDRIKLSLSTRQSLNSLIDKNHIYQNFNIYTKTGRTSNTFNSVNFLAMTKEMQKCFVASNDVFLSYDYDAYHVRLIANLINYNFNNVESVHSLFADNYGCSYDEGKSRTFRIMYGGITDEDLKIEFFFRVNEYVNELWNKYITDRYIETPIYRRRMYKRNLTINNKYKLLSYLVQAYETELNANIITKLQEYLKDKESKLILYNYDSFTFDISYKDGINVIPDTKNIIENNIFKAKVYYGKSLDNLTNVTEKVNERYK